MRQILFGFFLLFSVQLFSQQTEVILKDATNLERSLKEEEAFDKYKQVLAMDPKNLKALVRSSELCAAIGARQTDKNAKANYYGLAAQYADKAVVADSNSADAYYVRALAAGKLTEIETENKKLVANVRDIKTNADRALSINPNHGRANYVLGKWNFEVLTLSWAKRAAVKVLFGGMPPATIENAIKYMEKAKNIEPYFVPNYLDLARAYKYDHKPAQSIEVLNQLVKLPVRTTNDVALKSEGKKMLSEMQ